MVEDRAHELGNGMRNKLLERQIAQLDQDDQKNIKTIKDIISAALKNPNEVPGLDGINLPRLMSPQAEKIARQLIDDARQKLKKKS